MAMKRSQNVCVAEHFGTFLLCKNVQQNVYKYIFAYILLAKCSKMFTNAFLHSHQSVSAVCIANCNTFCEALLVYHWRFAQLEHFAMQNAPVSAICIANCVALQKYIFVYILLCKMFTNAFLHNLLRSINATPFTKQYLSI